MIKPLGRSLAIKVDQLQYDSIGYELAAGMKIATRNVNSIRKRLPLVLE